MDHQENKEVIPQPSEDYSPGSPGAMTLSDQRAPEIAQDAVQQTEDNEQVPLQPETQAPAPGNTQTEQKGIMKYFKGEDYFLAGNTTGDASKEKGEATEKREAETDMKSKQGTLTGVFLPVLQNILGVLLFIRVPQITGESGIRDSVLIVFICCLTTFLTTLSLSAIATNGRIFKGGTYYLISRSLGAPIGTAVGFCFYLGTTFAGAMYILGAVESFIVATKVELGGSFGLSIRVYGAILLAFLITVNLVGLKYVAKTGMVFLSIVLLAILGMYIGIFTQSARSELTYANGKLKDIEEKYQYAPGITGMSSENWEKNMDTRYTENSFFILLSVYFPSVTGIMAGSNRSGDLADPARSIPKGTLGAQFTTTIIYLSFPMLFGAVADRNTLQTYEYLTAAECSWPTKYLTIVAIILSSTGAGLQCLAGAPRLLEAISEDDNLPCFRVFKNSIKKIILLTGFICLAAIMIGDINAITPIITMFFLLCYGFVNLCCLFLDIVAFPNWRPTWKFYHKFLSFLGLGLCIFLMLAISWWSFLIVIFLVAILFTIVFRNKKVNANYGDSVDAVRISTAKNSLVGLIQSSKHVKNWIPIVLVVGDYDESKPYNEQIESKGALFFLNSIKQDIAFTIYGAYMNGSYSLGDIQRKREVETGISNWMAKEQIDVITKVVMVEDKSVKIDDNLPAKEKQQLREKQLKEPNEGMIFLMQAAGLGGLEPNTIMMEFPLLFKQFPAKAEKFVQFVSYGVRFQKAIIATIQDAAFAPEMELQDTNANDKEKTQENVRTKQKPFKQNIDVWSFSYENGLLILLTYFLSRSAIWKNCNIRLFIYTLQSKEHSKEEEIKRVQQKVESFLTRYRLLTKKMSIQVEIINIEDWQQVEGLLLTQGKEQQIKEHPEQFQNAPVDPTSTYGMDLTEQQQQQQQQQQQGGDANQLGVPQKPQRALSVMSQNQVTQLNTTIKGKSADSDLVIMNLPEPVNQQTNDYLEYLRSMTNGLKRVLMIRNAKQDCITEFT